MKLLHQLVQHKNCKISPQRQLISNNNNNIKKNMSSNSNFDDWVIEIRRTLEQELEDESEFPICIFNVPKSLKSSYPYSFTPQQVAIGPYHKWCPDVSEMERYKLAAAKRTYKQLQSLKFQSLVDQLIKQELRIRACYHRYLLELNGETLALMMAIDASFLLEFLQIHVIKEGKILTGVSSRMSHLVDFAGRKSAHTTIIRDIVMLENQIPLFVLRMMLGFLSPSLDSADETLFAMLMGLYQELSPFKTTQNLPNIQISKSSHLLDYLYDMIVPKEYQNAPEIVEADEQHKAMNDKVRASGDSSSVRKLLDLIWKILSKLNKGPVRLLKKLLLSKPIKLVLKLPWTIISRLPGISVLKQPVDLFFSQVKEESTKPENEASSSSNNSIDKPPLVDEITIPCVSELVEAGIHFSPTKGSISSIKFDTKTFTLYLPTINLDVNTEVVLRNLVAYEASNASSPLVLTRYTELMNGILDTKEDAKLLIEKKIIKNRLKSNEEVANMWNGMSKSIRLTKVPVLDKVIEDVNRYYNGRWKIKAQKFMKFYVFGSWQLLTFLATIMLLLLMTFQAFCSVYSCSRISYIKEMSTDLVG